MRKIRFGLLPLTAGVLLLCGPAMAADQAPDAPAGKDAAPLSKGEVIFMEMDTDKDGKISEIEYVTFTKKNAEKRFKAMDKDGDNYLSKEEALPPKRQKKAKGKPRKQKGESKDAPLTPAENQ